MHLGALFSYAHFVYITSTFLSARTNVNWI